MPGRLCGRGTEGGVDEGGAPSFGTREWMWLVFSHMRGLRAPPGRHARAGRYARGVEARWAPTSSTNQAQDNQAPAGCVV